MPHLALSEGSLYYRESGQGPPLLLLHANPGDSRDYAAVIPQLAERWRVLAPDWPGYGQSGLTTPVNEVSVATYFQTLTEFIDALNLHNLQIIGNSVGGLVATQLALAQPNRVRQLVLVSPGGFTPHNPLSRAFCRLQGSRCAIPPALFARGYLAHATPTTAAMLERARSEHSKAPCRSVNRALWRSFIAPDNDLRDRVAHLQTPVLGIFGRRDPTIPARRDGRVAAACLPSARIAVLDCGHAAFAEMPDHFMTLCNEFLTTDNGHDENVHSR